MYAIVKTAFAAVMMIAAAPFCHAQKETRTEAVVSGVYDTALNDYDLSEPTEYVFAEATDSRSDKNTRTKSKARTSKARSASGRSSSHSVSSSAGKGERVTLNQLAVSELFGEKYKRMKGCTLSIINGNFYSLSVAGNKELMDKILSLVMKDKDKSESLIESYSDACDSYVVGYNGVKVFLNIYGGGSSCCVSVQL